MRIAIVCVVVAFSLLATGVGSSVRADEIKKSALAVLYVGKVPSPRATQYQALLETYFSDVKVANRDDFKFRAVDPERVVLLDWSQGEADIMKMAEIKSPLGPRDHWMNPTVLLGSAGLLIAGPWKITGASG